MKKQIDMIVEHCRDCPFFNDVRGYDFYCLKQSKHIYSEEVDIFPEWCPLSDVEEKNEMV